MKIAGRSDAQRAVPDDEPVKPGQIEPVDLRENAVRLETGLLLEPADGADGGGVMDAGHAQLRHIREDSADGDKHSLNKRKLQVFFAVGDGLQGLPWEACAVMMGIQ